MGIVALALRTRTGSVARLAAPVKVAVQRFAYLLLVATAFVLMLLGKGESILIDRFRTGVVDLTAPVMNVLSRPAATVNDIVENARNLLELRSENARLREENARLLAWQAAARRLAVDNARLQTLLHFVPDARARFVSARVIADPGGAFVRSKIVNAGRREGVRKGQAVITGEGVAGRIFEAGLHSARVLLITDINSRIPVAIESTRARAIMVGDNGPRPRLAFLASSVEVAVGDRIVTSGQGGLFPPGLPLGIVATVKDGVVRIAPLVDFDRLEFVRVVDYPGVAPLDAADEDVRR